MTGNELSPNQVFLARDGSIVKLYRRVPGDGTRWFVADWWNGWAFCDSTIEPGDLAKRLPDDYAGTMT
jgi:hypothetical protein